MQFENPQFLGIKGLKRESLNHERNDENRKKSRLEHFDSSLPLKVESLSPPVQELMSNLTDESWRNALLPYVSKPSFQKLSKFVASER